MIILSTLMLIAVSLIAIAQNAKSVMATTAAKSALLK